MAQTGSLPLVSNDEIWAADETALVFEPQATVEFYSPGRHISICPWKKSDKGFQNRPGELSCCEREESRAPVKNCWSA